MKYCPSCRYCFEDTFSFCSRDQAELISAYAGPCAISHQYSVDRLLSEGVTGNVYAGKRLETDRPVAVKLLASSPAGDSEAGKLFRREALAIAHLNTRINHQHVVQTIDYGQTPDGTPYVVTELVAGTSLGEHLRGANDPPALDFALNTARQVADGLWAAHRCGVTHRSLNPSNVLLAQRYDGHYDAKIIDFGFSKLRKQSAAVAPDAERLLAYQAPEQRAGYEPGARADIYALGVLLYEMLVGDSQALAAVAAWSKQPVGEPPFLADLPEELPQPLRQLLAQALRKNPSERPDSAADMARQLSAIEERIRLGAVVVSEAAAQNSPSEVTKQSLFPVSAAFIKSGLAVPDSPASYIFTNNVSEDSVAEVTDAPKIELPTPESVVHQTAPIFEPRVEPPAQPRVVTLAVSPDDELIELEQEDAAAPSFVPLDSIPASRPHERRRPWLVYAMAVALAFAVIAVVYAQWPQTPPTTAGQSPQETVDAQQVAAPVVASAVMPALPEADRALPVADVVSPPESKEAEAVPENKQVAFSKPKTPTATAPTDSANKPSNATSVAAPDEAQQNVAGARGNEREKPATDQKASGPVRCDVTTSASEINLAAGSAASVTVVVNGEVNATHIRPTTKDWANVVVFPDSRPSQGDNSAKFSIVSVSQRKGNYSVNFKTPCGSRDLAVNVGGK